MSKVKCAAGLDSLNVREMADVPEIDIDKMKDKELEVDLPVPKVYMLRKNYEKIAPRDIREQEKQHCCVIVPVDEAMKSISSRHRTIEEQWEVMRELQRRGLVSTEDLEAVLKDVMHVVRIRF